MDSLLVRRCELRSGLIICSEGEIVGKGRESSSSYFARIRLHISNSGCESPSCFGLWLNIVVAAKAVAGVVGRFDRGESGVIQGISLGNACRLVLIHTIDVHRTCRPGLHGGVEAARPLNMTWIFRRIIPQTKQDQVKAVTPGWERGGIRLHSGHGSMCVLQDCEGAR